MIVRVDDLRFPGRIAHVFVDRPVAERVESGNEGVQGARGRVSASPNGFAVCRRQITRVVLFLTLVNNRDAICEHGISDCILRQRHV